MMDQLGIKTLRPGKSGNNQTGPGFEEATANDWMPTMPDALKMKDGTKVTTPEQWRTKRRAEILEDFEREVYGRIPANVPKVTWEVTERHEGNADGPRPSPRCWSGMWTTAFSPISPWIFAPASPSRPTPRGRFQS